VAARAGDTSRNDQGSRTPDVASRRTLDGRINPVVLHYTGAVPRERTTVASYQLMPFLLSLIKAEGEMRRSQIQERVEPFVVGLKRRCGQRSVGWALARLKQAGLVTNEGGFWRPTSAGKRTEYTEAQARSFNDECRVAETAARKARTTPGRVLP
jgi:hypothetical protein